MSLYHLVYVSIAEHPFGPEELLQLLERSRENNLRDEITGMLLYKDGKFMQLLEGPEQAVCATYARIAKDRRHREITVLLEGERPERDFEEWSMGFHDLEAESAQNTPGFSQFLTSDLSVFEFASDPSKAHQLLRIFRRI